MQMLEPRQNHRLSPVADRIVHLLADCFSHTHLAQIQAQILLRHLHSHPTIFSSFLTACRSLRRLSTAALFFLASRPKAPLCNSTIRTLSRSTPSSDTAFFLFRLMVRNSVPPNCRTFPALLSSLSDVGSLRQGRIVHTHALKTGFFPNVHVQNSLLDLYSSCGDMTSADELFDEMPLRDVVSWTSMIVAYKNKHSFHDALVVFRTMQDAGVELNRVTIVSVLSACAGCQDFRLGLAVHGYAVRREWQPDVVLGTALVDMYGKCGRARTSVKLFDTMPEKNVYTWNCLICSLATVEGGEAVRLFFKMQEQGGLKADEATLVAALAACSHAGMVRTGKWIFRTILDGKHGFMPGVKHYGCMVDMLARAGLLEEALEWIEVMPFDPNPVIWRAMLGGCMAHGSSELSELAVGRLSELDPANATAYHALLGNLCSEPRKPMALEVGLGGNW